MNSIQLRLGYVFLYVLFCAAFASAQQQPAAEWLTRAKLPVVVVDSSGHSVHGLPASAFTVSKGVKGAKISGVQEIAPAEVNGKRPVTIVFDGIANPFEIQKRARDAILVYLADAARHNQPVNLLITAQSGGRVVHSANTPPAVTLVALEKLDKLTRALGGSFTSGVSADDTKKLTEEIEGEFNRLKEFEQKVETATFYRILSVQFDTLQMIATGLSRVNGRKAVLWITSQFPVKVDEGKNLLALNSIQATDANEWWVMTTEYEKAVRMLNAASISVYTSQAMRTSSLVNQPGGILPSSTAVRGSGADLTFVGLTDFSTRTGGKFIPFTTAIGSMIDAMQHDADSYYVIDYELPPPPDHLDWKELGIKVAKEKVTVRRTDSLFLISTRHQNR